MKNRKGSDSNKTPIEGGRMTWFDSGKQMTDDDRKRICSSDARLWEVALEFRRRHPLHREDNEFAM